MEKLLVLGTGAGRAINCYNTCFLLQNENQQYLLVDAGGGIPVMKQIRDIGVSINEIHDMFVSHKHIDHLLGVFYILRTVCQFMCDQKYTGIFNIYCAKELKQVIERFVMDTFHDVLIEAFKESVVFHEIVDEQKIDIIGYQIRILDLHSNEGKQYGFQTKLENGRILTFLGDVPCDPSLYKKIENTDWVLHEVFCREAESEKFKPHEKNHSTVKDVCEKMEPLRIKNLVLWHTKDNNIEKRKELYTKEAKQYFEGNVYVPNDLDIIEL